MIDPERCPKCGESTVIPGRIDNSDPQYFIPAGTRLFRMSPGVLVSGAFSACSSCGHVWTSLAPMDLGDFIRKYGADLAKQHFENLEVGPHHGVPDVLKARLAAEGVAEIDALMMDAKQGEATRRFRELARTTWDEAVDAVLIWRNLGREEKLALLGWKPKDGSKDDPASTWGHPMRDPLLDG